jgi:hypothetical protein
MERVIVAGSRLSRHNVKSINNRNTTAAKVTFEEPPFAMLSPIPFVASAIAQHSAAIKEKNSDRLMLSLFSNIFTLLERPQFIRRIFARQSGEYPLNIRVSRYYTINGYQWICE